MEEGAGVVPVDKVPGVQMTAEEQQVIIDSIALRIARLPGTSIPDLRKAEVRHDRAVDALIAARTLADK